MTYRRVFALSCLAAVTVGSVIGYVRARSLQARQFVDNAYEIESPKSGLNGFEDEYVTPTGNGVVLVGGTLVTTRGWADGVMVVRLALYDEDENMINARDIEQFQIVHGVSRGLTVREQLQLEPGTYRVGLEAYRPEWPLIVDEKGRQNIAPIASFSKLVKID
ncbi:MAG: hypothetical protein U0790_11890 [Isosphaeraceae bacterium]